MSLTCEDTRFYLRFSGGSKDKEGEPGNEAASFAYEKHDINKVCGTCINSLHNFLWGKGEQEDQTIFIRLSGGRIIKVTHYRVRGSKVGEHSKG